MYPNLDIAAQWGLFAVAGFGWFAYVLFLYECARRSLTVLQ